MLNLIRDRRSQTVFTFLKPFLPILLTLLIIVTLLSQISIGDAMAMLDNIVYSWVGWGLLLYFITNILRVLRLWPLLPAQKLHFERLLAILIAQSMFNNILPARTGEFSFVYFLNKYEHISLEHGTVALILARLFDLVAVSILFIIATTITLKHLPSYAEQIIWFMLIMLGIMIGLLLSLVWLGKRSLTLLHRFLGFFKLNDYRLIKFGLKVMTQIVEAFETTYSLKRYLRALIWSLLLWGCTFAWFYTFLMSINIEIVGGALVTGATFAILSKAIPLISIGGFGAHEAGWTVGFILVGFDTSAAILSGLAVNVLTLIASIIFGLGAILYLRQLVSVQKQGSCFKVVSDQ